MNIKRLEKLAKKVEEHEVSFLTSFKGRDDSEYIVYDKNELCEFGDLVSNLVDEVLGRTKLPFEE